MSRLSKEAVDGLSDFLSKNYAGDFQTEGRAEDGSAESASFFCGETLSGKQVTSLLSKTRLLGLKDENVTFSRSGGVIAIGFTPAKSEETED